MSSTYRILVASYTPNITTLEFDPAAGTLTDVAQSPAGTNPSWIAAHPTSKSLILATNEVTDGKVHLFRLLETGKLKLLESMGSAGEDPAHLAVLEDEVIVANYSSGTVLPISFSTTAPHFLSSNPTIQLKGTGPNAARQSSSHPHQIYPTSATEILIPDLGADRIVRFSRKAQGEWVEVGAVKSNPGTGPRHIQLHDGVLYVIEELTNTLAAHVFPPTSSPSLITRLPTLPALSRTQSLAVPHFEPNSVTPPITLDDTPLPLLAAELLLVTKPQTLLFATNRNEVHPEGDSITIYSPLKSPKGKEGFEVVRSVRTGLKHARGAAFGGPDDKYLVVGGSDKGGVKVFERFGERGDQLKVVAHMPGVIAPTGFLWV